MTTTTRHPERSEGPGGVGGTPPFQVPRYARDDATIMTTTPEQAAKEVAERIRAGRNFLITSHRNPDGDALGSGLALQRLIRKLGKEARMQVRDGFNTALRNIPGANEVAITDTLPPDYPNGLDGV